MLVASSGMVALLLLPALQAADDITLSGLSGLQETDAQQTADLRKEAYNTVVNELGVAIANKPLAPAETLGVYGFDIGVGASVAFIHTRDTDLGPSAWTYVTEDEDPTDVLLIPWVQARKGLPLSLEIGGSVGYLGFTRQTCFSGFGRWGLIEGYSPIPDLTLQVGYSGYVGNDELEEGVMDVSGTLGYTLPFGTIMGINQAVFSPYLGVGNLFIHAQPRLSTEQQALLNIGPVSALPGAEARDMAFRHFVLNGGFRIVNGSFQLRIAASYAPKVLATVNAGMGFTY